MKRSLLVVIAVGGLLATALTRAADWPQWRGPDRNGIAPQSPPLATTLPKQGPPKLWAGNAVEGGDRGGFGSVAVAGGKAYVYAYTAAPVKWRMVSKRKLELQGYDAAMPGDLSKAVEEARVSDARKAIKDNKEINAWVNAWLNEHVAAAPADPAAKADIAKWKELARTRLVKGEGALPLDALAKLAPIIDKKFDTEADLAAWLKEAGLDEAAQKKFLQAFGPGETEKDIEEALCCLDVGTGKLEWKTPFEGQFFWYGPSYTPTVAGGRVYVCDSKAHIHCLDGKTGAKVWESEPFGPPSFTHNRSSSVLLADGAAIVLTEVNAAAVDVADGKKLWINNKIINQQCSAAAWTSGSKTWAVINGSNKLWCVDPKDGKAAWSVEPCGGASTPEIVGDICAVSTGEKDKGIVAYKLSPDKAEVLWKAPNKDSHSSVLISGDRVFAVGGGYEGGKGSIMCLDLKDGKTVWEEPIGPAQLSSPLLADGKIIAVVGGELVIFKADPARYVPIGRANLGLVRWSSPGIADGKLFLRTGKEVVCYDLSNPRQ